jgi:hypothetical protein
LFEHLAGFSKQLLEVCAYFNADGLLREALQWRLSVLMGTISGTHFHISEIKPAKLNSNWQGRRRPVFPLRSYNNYFNHAMVSDVLKPNLASIYRRSTVI